MYGDIWNGKTYPRNTTPPPLTWERVILGFVVGFWWNWGRKVKLGIGYDHRKTRFSASLPDSSQYM